MVTKKVNFRGSALADRLGTLNNFICNDETNLKFSPITDSGTQEGISENRFRISESIAPAWSKISVGYKKTAIYGEHDGTIEVYGLDNLGLETLLYQTKINLTEAGLQNVSFIDMLRSSCTGAVTCVDNENILNNHMEIRMPKLREKYDDVSLQAAWYDPAWAYRKGVPINLSLNSKHTQTIWTDDTGKDAVITVPYAYRHEYWYEVIYVTYDAHMQADFGDLRFTGFDGVSPIEYWIINKTDSSNATIMLRIPWYWGWNENERPQLHTNYGVSYGIGETPNINNYTNINPKFIWMYYGNSSCDNGTKTPVDGEDGIYWFDDFTTDTSSEWTVVGAAGANSTFTWDNSSSLDMQINANNTENGFFAYHALPAEISGTYAAFDIIWKLENIPTTAGNYDAAVWVGTTDDGTTQPRDCLGLWITPSDVYAVQFKDGASTTWTAGSLSFNHDDTEPLYIRARIHPSHESKNLAGITWEISKDCRKWTQVVNLIYPTDISVIPYSELTQFGMRMSAWAAAPAFNMELDTDWIMITQSHKVPCRSDEFNEHFEFSDWNHQWTGTNYDGANNTYTLDYSNSEVDFAITGGSQIYTAGTDTAARIEIQNLVKYDSIIIETRLDTHTRSTNGSSRATLYTGTTASEHFSIFHQLNNATQYNNNILCISTNGGSDSIKTYQQYEKEPIAEGPIWLRIIYDIPSYRIIGQYSRNGYDWYNCGGESIYYDSDITDIGLVLQNDGSGNATCSFDYLKVTTGPYAANFGETFTAEQAYTDYDDIAPESAIYYQYTDDFEDNDLSGARTYPYREMTSFTGTLAVESAAPITGTYSLKHTGNGSDVSTNIVQFEDKLKEYTATFDFKLSTQGAAANTPYLRLWVLRGANDGNSYTAVDTYYDGTNQKLRVINYHNNSGTAIVSAVTWLAGAKLGTATTYSFTIIDNGTSVTVKVGSTTYINNATYSTGTNVSKVLPGQYKGFGANADSAARWDNIIIKPGYWYGGIQYTNPALTTAVTKTVGDWQTIYDPQNSYYFRMPSSFIRNQPMILAWKEQGQTTEWQYTKPFYPKTGGVFYAGPNGLDKYIGMKTKIIFEGDDEDTLEITDITYEYEV